VHAVSPSTRAVFLDPSGATLGYATGKPATDKSATSIAWRDGIDLRAVALRCDGLGMLGYFADPSRLEREIDAYQQLLPANAPLDVILRPMPPDSRDADELAARAKS
jgi:hypothetical protein